MKGKCVRSSSEALLNAGSGGRLFIFLPEPSHLLPHGCACFVPEHTPSIVEEKASGIQNSWGDARIELNSPSIQSTANLLFPFSEYLSPSPSKISTFLYFRQRPRDT